VQDYKAKLPDAIRGYSYHIGPGNEFNMAIRENEVIMAIIKVVAAFKSRRRDEEHTHKKYKISNRDELLQPTGGVADV